MTIYQFMESYDNGVSYQFFRTYDTASKRLEEFKERIIEDIIFEQSIGDQIILIGTAYGPEDGILTVITLIVSPIHDIDGYQDNGKEYLNEVYAACLLLDDGADDYIKIPTKLFKSRDDCQYYIKSLEDSRNVRDKHINTIKEMKRLNDHRIAAFYDQEYGLIT